MHTLADILPDAMKAQRAAPLLPYETIVNSGFMPHLERNPKRVSRNLADAFKAARMDGTWPLLVWGDAGTGKSRFALIVHDWYGGKFYDFHDLVGDYQLCRLGDLYDEDHINRPKIHDRRFWEMIGEYRIVIVDEIGMRKDTDHSRECLTRLLNTRECKPLLLISNLSPEEIAAHYDDRIASRMCSGKVVRVYGDDMRLGKR